MEKVAGEKEGLLSQVPKIIFTKQMMFFDVLFLFFMKLTTHKRDIDIFFR